MPALCPAALRREPSAHLSPSVWGQLPKCPLSPSALFQAQSPPSGTDSFPHGPHCRLRSAGATKSSSSVRQTSKSFKKEAINARCWPPCPSLGPPCPSLVIAERQGVGAALMQASGLRGPRVPAANRSPLPAGAGLCCEGPRGPEPLSSPSKRRILGGGMLQKGINAAKI